MIAKVFHMLNDDVLCFDEKRKPLDKYSGKYAKVVESIITDATDGTKFFIQKLNTPISKELFQNKKMYTEIKRRR